MFFVRLTKTVIYEPPYQYFFLLRYFMSVILRIKALLYQLDKGNQEI